MEPRRRRRQGEFNRSTTSRSRVRMEPRRHCRQGEFNRSTISRSNGRRAMRHSQPSTRPRRRPGGTQRGRRRRSVTSNRSHPANQFRPPTIRQVNAMRKDNWKETIP